MGIGLDNKKDLHGIRMYEIMVQILVKNHYVNLYVNLLGGYNKVNRKL